MTELIWADLLCIPVGHSLADVPLLLLAAVKLPAAASL